MHIRKFGAFVFFISELAATHPFALHGHNKHVRRSKSEKKKNVKTYNKILRALTCSRTSL